MIELCFVMLPDTLWAPVGGFLDVEEALLGAESAWFVISRLRSAAWRLGIDGAIGSTGRGCLKMPPEVLPACLWIVCSTRAAAGFGTCVTGTIPPPTCCTESLCVAWLLAISFSWKDPLRLWLWALVGGELEALCAAWVRFNSTAEEKVILEGPLLGDWNTGDCMGDGECRMGWLLE